MSYGGEDKGGPIEPGCWGNNDSKEFVFQMGHKSYEDGFELKSFTIDELYEYFKKRLINEGLKL